MPNKRAYVETIDESWRQWDPDLAASALAPGFTLDDPAWPEPVTATNLAGYMARWRACVSALGGSEQFDRRDGIEQSMDGDLLRFDYWRFSGTPFEGTSVMRIGAQGVLHERITYRSLTGVRSFLRGEAGLALNNQDVRWQDWSGEPGEAPVPRYKTFLSDCDTPTSELSQGMLEFSVGSRSRPHWHTPVETYYVLSGSGIAHVGYRTFGIAAGAVIYMPSRVVHWFEASTS